MGCRILGLLFLLLAALGVTAAPTAGHETGFLDRSVVVDGVEYRYEIYVPRDYDPHRAWPIILVLHGGGDYGSDGIKPTVGVLADGIRLHPERFPSIVVFAQGHADGTPSWQRQGGKAALKAVEEAIAEFNGDRSRIYITGASAGGNGAWFLAYHYPARFAAAVVVCGFVSDFTGHQSHVLYPSIAGDGPDRYARVAAAVKGLPIWIVHGAADKTVPVEESRRMAAALRAMTADVRYTELPEADHKGAWEFAYNDAEVASWLLSQRQR